MRRCAAILVLITFAFLNAIDGICCPDGCTHEETTSSSPSGPQSEGVCLLCTGGLQSPALDHLVSAVFAGSNVTRIPVGDPTDVPPDPPEHPPRS